MKIGYWKRTEHSDVKRAILHKVGIVILLNN